MKKQELIDSVLNDLDNNWVVSKQDILALIGFLIESEDDYNSLCKAIALLIDDKLKHID